ncbi:MAG: elongation factor Ts [Bacteroidetes bacterium]|nr:translation elongation factor Ts [Rhodothermaceae bacterium RA]RMH70211.1 MAG: elongation factor Ts [Bacteroidota bacterium]
MAISAKDVKRLRDMTGVGMMDCKKALEEANGDFEAAVELLRKKGQKVAAKRADREAKEGLITTALSDDRRVGVMAEVNCETDFVARNDEFAAFAQAVADLILAERPADLEALRALPMDGQTVGEAVIEMTGKIGEKIDIRRFVILTAEDGQVIAYIHPGAKLGVLVSAAGEGDVEAVGRDVAMQVAALNPIAVTREEVPEEVRAKELEIGREAARNEGKPEHIIDRIAQGKLERFYKDHVLLEQPFVKDASVSVQEMLKQHNVTVTRFVRFALGD